MSVSSLFAAAAIAGRVLMPADYSLICQTDQASGLSWERGGWVQTQFRPRQYVVTAKPENLCREQLASGLEELGPRLASRDVCLNVREVGDPYEPGFSQKCTETYYFEGDRQQVILQCYEGPTALRALVDGRFSRSSIAGPLTDPAPATGRSNIYVEAGRCSRI